MDEVYLEVKGLDELDQAMSAFNAEFNKNAMAEGVEAAAAYLAAAAKAEAPVVSEDFGTHRPGELRDAIAVVMRKPNPGYPHLRGAYVCPIYGVSGANAPNQDPGYWGQFVEYGSVHNPEPDGFLRRTVDGNAQKAVDVFVEEAAKQFSLSG